VGSTAKNWLLGCGLSCLAVVVLVVALAIGFGVWMRGKMRGFEQAIDQQEQLEQRFGPDEAFVPWPDGAVPTERMERFLAVRESTSPARGKIAEFFTMLPKSGEEQRQLDDSSPLEKLRFAMRIGSAGVGLAENTSQFLRERNSALDREGLGMGEYTYIYVTAYYAALGHSPADGKGRGSPEELAGRWESPEALTTFVAQLRGLHQSMGQEADDATWAAALAAEIEALESDSRRAPWQDGLPEAIRASIEPYRDRLDSTYNAATNPFELAHGEKRGMSIRID
jgi:hypothetical protein